MLDGVIRRVIDPPMDQFGRRLAGLGVGANMVTLIGLGAALAAGVALSLSQFWLGAALILASRLADGLDGAIARATVRTDFGGLLDIVCDFVFYAAIPLGFALARPQDAVPAAVLLAAFYVNGASFLGFAVMAAKRGLETQARGMKSLYFTTGLAEGFETIAVFLAMCLWPSAFAPLAYGFAGLCALTTLARMALAARTF